MAIRSLIGTSRPAPTFTGSTSEIVFQPLPQDDPVRRRPDISLAKEKLHWEPTIPLRDGLTRTVAFFRELLAAG